MQVAALILGILALAFLFVPVANVVLSPMMGTAALVLGLIGHRAALAAKEDGIMGKAGYITGLVALVVSVALIITVVSLIRSRCDGCDWSKKDEKVELTYEQLPDELKKEIRDEVRREVHEEMERARQDRIEQLKKDRPWTDEQWRKALEERFDEWVDWLDTMPLHEDVEAEPATPGAPPDAPDPPPVERKPAKKPAKLPDLTYPGEALESPPPEP
jgi:hypothetical protein